MLNINKKVFWVIGILLGGVLISVLLISIGPKPKKEVFEPSAPSIKTLTVKPQNRAVRIFSTGIVSADKEVRLTPEVSGRIIFISKNLEPGGKVKKGEILIKIDPKDYQLAVNQQEGQLQASKLELEQEKAKKIVAKSSWDLLGDGKEGSPLALRQIHFAVAQSKLMSTQSALDRAKLNLERTIIRAPFTASVITEQVDKGQVVNPQSPLCRLIGSDELRVIISTPVENLKWIEFSTGKNKRGSVVIVKQRMRNNQFIQRMGKVTRLIEEIDSKSRRAQLLIKIPGITQKESELPLLPGAFVEVEILGKTQKDITAIPSHAITSENIIWTIQKDSTLKSMQVFVEWSSPETSFVRGITQPIILGTSPIETPLDGLKVNPFKVQESSKFKSKENTNG